MNQERWHLGNKTALNVVAVLPESTVTNARNVYCRTLCPSRVRLIHRVMQFMIHLCPFKCNDGMYPTADTHIDAISSCLHTHMEEV